MAEKAVVLLGSPRKHGNSERLAAAFVEGVEEKGGSAEIVRTASLTVSGCVACDGCWSAGKPCIIDDDMNRVYPLLEECTTWVFAAPLYWYSWPTQIKPVLDRMLPYFAEKPLRTLSTKKAVLLSVAADDTDRCFEALRLSFRAACELAEFPIMGEICVPGVAASGDIESKKEWLDKARELGRTI